MHKTIGIWLVAVAAMCGAILLATPPARATLPGFMLARMGTVSGTIKLPAGTVIPSDGVIVSFFDRAKGPPPTKAGLHRVPQKVVRSDPKGAFSVSLLPGSYNIGALLRARGAGPGPPRPGEKFFFAMTDGEKLADFKVRTRQHTNYGVIQVAVPARISEMTRCVTVRGTVTDEKGHPFPGALVLVKHNPNITRPLFISDPADKQGHYQIKVPPDTTYYFLARQSIQTGRPLAGSYVGTYGKTAPILGKRKDSIGAPAGMVGRGGMGKAKPVRGAAGTVIDHVDITMFKVPNPEATRKKFMKEWAKGKPGRAMPPRPAPMPNP